MLRYLLKTLLQMNLFSDTIRNSPNGTDPFFNGSLPSFNSSLLDWGNFTGFNGKRVFFFVLFFCFRDFPLIEPLSALICRRCPPFIGGSDASERGAP